MNFKLSPFMDSKLFVFFTTATGWRVKYSEERKNFFFCSQHREGNRWIHCFYQTGNCILGASDSRCFPPSPLHSHGLPPPIARPPPCREQEALPILLLPIFHLVILAQARFVKSEEPSPNSYAYSSKQVGENFILQLYSPFHFPISKTRLKICTEVFPQHFQIKIPLTIRQNQASQFKPTGQTPLSASLPAKSGSGP